MGSHNLVWTKVSNVWWVGEKLENPPEDLIAGLKKDAQVVKFFNPDDPLSVVKNPSNIVDYETNKEDYIQKGLRLLKKKPAMLKDFKKDILEAETRIGGDLNIIERLEPKPADSTPRKSIVKEIFGTPAVEKKTPVVEKKTPPNSTPNKANLRKVATSPRKSKGPTPQVVPADNKKFHCEHCGFGTDRMNVLIVHRKTHTDSAASSTTSRSAPRPARVSLPPTTTPVAVPEILQAVTRRSVRPAPKTTPVATPKKTPQPRKRKLATASEEKTPIAKAEILADWSDEDDGLGDTVGREVRKKQKTSKDLFDAIFQATKSAAAESTEESKPTLKEEDGNERRSDDEMDEEMPLLSVSSAPVRLLEKESPGKKETEEAAPKIDEDFDAQFEELMKETALKLPDFDATSKSEEETKVISEEETKVKSVEETKAKSEEETKLITEEDTKAKSEEETKVKSEEVPKEDSEKAKANSDVELKTQAANEAEMAAEKPEEKEVKVAVKTERPSVSPEKVKPVEPVNAKCPAPATPKKAEEAPKSPVKTYAMPTRYSARAAAKTASIPVSAPVAVTTATIGVTAPPTVKTAAVPVSTPVAVTTAAAPVSTPAKKSTAAAAPTAASSVTKAVASPVTTPVAAKSASVSKSLNAAAATKETTAPATPTASSTPVAPTPPAPATPVYAKKSAPKPIEERPRRTPARGRRASAAKASVVEPIQAPAETPVDVTTPTSVSAAATEEATSKADVVTPTVSAPVPTVAQPIASTVATLVEPLKTTAPAEKVDSLKQDPAVPSQAAVTSVPATQKVESSTQPTSNGEVKTEVAPATVAPDTKPTEVPAVSEPAKKPSATAAPTASALALAQRKQQQQQRGISTAIPKPRQGRTYPGKKTITGAPETTQSKPTATVKPTVNVEDDSIIRQALQVQKGNLKSSPAVEQKEVPVEHVVHLVPVQNPDGSVSYMLLSLNDSDQLQLDQFEGQTAPSSNIEAVYIDKPVDCETFMNTITPSAPQQQQQQQQQVQLQAPLQVSQPPSRQPTASQQVKQLTAAAAATAKASTSQPQQQQQAQPTQIITTDAGSATQQFIIQQDGQELLAPGTVIQSEDGSFVDFSQLTSGDNNIYFMTEDGSIIDPSAVNGIDLQQLFSSQ